QRDPVHQLCRRRQRRSPRVPRTLMTGGASRWSSGLAVDLDVGGRSGLDPDGAPGRRITECSAAVVARAARGDLVDAGGERDAEGAVCCGAHLDRNMPRTADGDPCGHGA
ncbi:hypothetical protein, partial [Ferrimicrobium acidiphilum]|uniref:hypothetical protein n=1 Tax=Ferrimicrobium acidiphilum TaxID=121039 RepID=UPI0023F4AB9F